MQIHHGISPLRIQGSSIVKLTPNREPDVSRKSKDASLPNMPKPEFQMLQDPKSNSLSIKSISELVGVAEMSSKLQQLPSDHKLFIGNDEMDE